MGFFSCAKMTRHCRRISQNIFFASPSHPCLRYIEKGVREIVIYKIVKRMLCDKKVLEDPLMPTIGMTILRIRSWDYSSKFSDLDHSAFLSTPTQKKGVRSRKAFICFTSHRMNPMYEYSLKHICVYETDLSACLSLHFL